MQMPSLIPEPGSLFDRIMTIVLASIVWFVCAVPIITLPAATAGLFATLAPLVRGEDAEIFAVFFGTMLRQWFTSTVVFIADLALGAVIVINFMVLNRMNLPQPVFWLFLSIYLFLTLAALMVNLYLWPLLVLSDLRLRQLVSLSVKLAFTHALWSLFTLSLVLSSLALVLFVPLILSVTLGFSLTVLIVNWGAWQVLKGYALSADSAGPNRS